MDRTVSLLSLVRGISCSNGILKVDQVYREEIERRTKNEREIRQSLPISGKCWAEELARQLEFDKSYGITRGINSRK